jgi:hypothetical protein
MFSYLLQNSSRKESYQGQDCDHTHITDILLDIMLDTPERNGQKADKGDPVLLESERFSCWSDWLNFDFTLAVGRASGTVGNKEEEPDEKDGKSRHREGDSKPLDPAKGWIHCFKRNQVLR